MEGEARARERISGDCILSLPQVFSDYRSHDPLGDCKFYRVLTSAFF